MSGSTYDYTTRSGKRKWGFAIDLGKTWDAEKGRNVRQQLRREGFARKIDAEHAMQEEQHGVKVGTAPSLADRRLTTAQWCDRWLNSKVNIRPSTRASYGHIVESYIKPGIGHIPLTQLRADHLDDMLAMIRAGWIKPKVARRARTASSPAARYGRSSLSSPPCSRPRSSGG
jgi:hypothetical protein